MFRKGLLIFIVIGTFFIGTLPGYAQGKVVVDKWKVPFIDVLTGAIAHIGLEIQWATQKAVKEINATGGIAGKPIELTTYDTGYDPARAVSCMKEAVEGSLVIIGPMSTMDVRACSAIAAQEGVMNLPVASSITEVKKVYPWAVVFIPSIELMARTVLDWLKMYPDIKSVVIFKDIKNPVWIETAGYYNKFCEEAGIKVLDIIDVAAESVDVSAPVVRALGKKPDSLLFGTEPGQTARLIGELHDRGWKKTDHIACHPAASNEAFYKVGGEKVNGVYILGFHLDYDYPNPKWQAFIKDFDDAHGKKGAKPAMYVMPYYDVVYAVKAAMEKTGVTGDPSKLKEERVKIRDYIRSLKDFPGIYKPFSLDKEGSALMEIMIAQVKSGKAVIVTRK